MIYRHSRYSRREVLERGAKAGLALPAVAYLSGCVGGGDDDEAEGTVNLLYDWTYLGTGVRRYWDQAEELSSSEPAQIGQLNGVPFGSLYQTVEAQIRAQAGADTYSWFSDYLTFELKERDEIAPLDDLVGEDETDHWLLASARFDGQYWACPLVQETLVMVINRRYFEQAGVDVDEGGFESYDAFIEACDRLKAEGITPIEASSGDQLGSDKWAEMLTMQVCENPADIPRGVAGELPLEAPVFSNWMEKLPVLRDNYMNDDVADLTEQQSNTRFLDGSGAIQIMYTGPIFQSNKSEFEVIGFPKSDAPFNRPASTSVDVMVVAGYSDAQDATGELLTFLHDPALSELWWESTGTLPLDDRFDASVLSPAARRTWDFVIERESDPYALWYPGNFFPRDFGSYLLGVSSEVMAGASTEQAMEASQKIFDQFRDQNPDQVEVAKQGATAIQGLVDETGDA